MKKNSSALIAALTLTAIILGVVLMVNTINRPSQAAMLYASPEFSLMTAGPGAANDEALVVIDNRAQKMIVYKMESGLKFKIIAAHDFSKDLH